MRSIIAIAGVAAAAVLLAVSMLMNLRFGLTLGQSELDKLAYAGASVAGDVIKILAPFWIGWAWKEARYTALTLAGLLFLVTVGYSITSGLGFAAQNRAAIAGEQEAKIVAYEDLRAGRSRLLARIDALPATSPAEALRARLEGFRDQRRWMTTSGCTDATVPASVAFCVAYRQTEADLAVAERRATLEAQVADLSTRIAAATTATAVRGEADPQIALLIRILPIFEASAAELGLAIIVMALVELGAAFGFFLSLAPLTSGNRAVAETTIAALPPPPEDDVNRWGVERLQVDPSAVLTLEAIEADYEQWRRGQDLGPVDDIRPILEGEGLQFIYGVPPGGRRRVWLIRGVGIVSP